MVDPRNREHNKHHKPDELVMPRTTKQLTPEQVVQLLVRMWAGDSRFDVAHGSHNGQFFFNLREKK